MSAKIEQAIQLLNEIAKDELHSKESDALNISLTKSLALVDVARAISSLTIFKFEQQES